MRRLVCRRKVRHDADFFDDLEVLQSLRGNRQLTLVESESIHAGVDLQPHDDRFNASGRRTRLQPIDLMQRGIRFLTQTLGPLLSPVGQLLQ